MYSVMVRCIDEMGDSKFSINELKRFVKAYMGNYDEKTFKETLEILCFNGKVMICEDGLYKKI